MSSPLNKQPLHKHEGPQWKLTGDIRGQLPQSFFVSPKFCCAQNDLFKTNDKNKIFPP